MRQIITTILLLVAVATTATAQPQRGGAGGGNTGSPNQRLQSFQMEQITSALKLEGERLAKFEELYKAFNEENRKLMSKGRGTTRGGGQGGEMPQGGRAQHRETPAESERPSEEEVEANILRSFESSRLSIDLKERYYTLFREILSPSEISTMYEIERRTRERFQSEMQKRAQGGGQGGGPGRGQQNATSAQ